jgi:hypothetical protein
METGGFEMRNDGLVKRLLLMCALLMVGVAGMPCSVLGASVSVYAEGAYTDSDLKLYIYADITEGPILSFGVKVAYPSSLTYSSATKNESVWYFGNGSAEYDYMAPEVQDSSVVIIGGKLDTSNPTEGVEGDRVLLGTVTFTHSGVTDFSGVSVTYGRGTGSDSDTFKNFVDVDGGVLDGSAVNFQTPTIAQPGDANADGNINSVDAQYVREIFFKQKAWTILADCNSDGDVNSTDAQCIREKFFNP